MSIKKIVLFIGFVFFAIYLNGQNKSILSSTDKKFPTESVFIHYNSSLLFSGETLYYKFYCLNNLSNKLSNISKVGYVELVGENRQVVFKHKIALNNGLGYGEFLLPSDILSGNYKLIGYTLWMNNNQQNKFFIADLKVINPYKKINEKTIKSDSLNTQPRVGTAAIQTKNYELKLANNVYKPREEVRFSIVSNKVLQSDVSISVHKVNNISAPSLITSYKSLNNTVSKTISQSNIVTFPEIRGNILKGTLKSDSLEVSNKKIALSIPSAGLVNIVKTNEVGTFNLNISEYHNNNDLYVQVFENNTDNYKLDIAPSFKADYKDLNFNKFEIFESEVSKILDRSILNQIDNAYLFTKTDSILVQESKLPFSTSYDLEYNLDDYNRFSEMKEVFVEIINQAQIYEVSNDNFQFAVLNQNGSYDKSIPPLLVIDGIIVKDANLLVNYNAKSIKTISIIKNKYYLGSDIFNGVIAFQTINNDFNRKVGDFVFNKFQLYDLEKIKHYKNVSYKGKLLTQNSRIPDYRKQLFWNPSIKLNHQTSNFSFFTSDNTGQYELRIEGFTEQGEPISLSKTFKVTDE
ncbi:hypothetical protein [Pontimicrobium aquaticum]|uniref:MG2 domain-containing protein n=1 Tax=Pontimicrobium aquaticum TaxID=2565367 RepID=A0A4U0EPI0_9FLAO|nr:hypothetical protein [Pontimicrobium aquaticum]TJY33460.1 hypothetical protein E5167_13250 [Pontimicrobium aquaticum]